MINRGGKPSGVFNIDENIKEKSTSIYIAYRVAKNFLEVHIRKDNLVLFMRPIQYDDPKGMVKKIPDGYNWTMDRRVYLKSVEDIEYVLGLIEQSYKDVL